MTSKPIPEIYSPGMECLGPLPCAFSLLCVCTNLERNRGSLSSCKLKTCPHRYDVLMVFSSIVVWMELTCYGMFWVVLRGQPRTNLGSDPHLC